jgi:rod shape-determining protein MreD
MKHVMADYGGFSPARIFASLLPVLLAVAAVIAVNLPISITGGLLPAPLLALAPVYFWALLRPDLMPPAAVLGIGLLEDLLSGGPPGLWAAGFLAAYALADRQRDSLAGLSGIGAVIGFAAAMFVTAAVAYALASLVYWRLAPIAPLLLTATVTIAFYPLAAWFMGWVQRRVVGPMRGH